MKNIIQWFLYSSADPTKISLTLKAGASFLVLFGLGKYVTTADANTLVESITNIVVLLAQIVSAVATAYGLVRKIFNSFSGETLA